MPAPQLSCRHKETSPLAEGGDLPLSLTAAPRDGEDLLCDIDIATSELSSCTSLPAAAAEAEPCPRCCPGISPVLEQAVLQLTQTSFLMLGADRRLLVSEWMVFPKTEGTLLGSLRGLCVSREPRERTQ